MQCTKIYNAHAQPQFAVYTFCLVTFSSPLPHCCRDFILSSLSAFEYTKTTLILASPLNYSLIPQPFATAPYVFVTAAHYDTNKHDAASVWAEDVTRYNFRACLRELTNFDGAHKYLSVVSTQGFYNQIFGDLVEQMTVLSLLRLDRYLLLQNSKLMKTEND